MPPNISTSITAVARTYSVEIAPYPKTLSNEIWMNIIGARPIRCTSTEVNIVMNKSHLCRSNSGKNQGQPKIRSWASMPVRFETRMISPVHSLRKSPSVRISVAETGSSGSIQVNVDGSPSFSPDLRQSSLCHLWRGQRRGNNKGCLENFWILDAWTALWLRAQQEFSQDPSASWCFLVLKRFQWRPQLCGRQIVEL